MSWFVVDVESDGPIIGLNSMVCFGAVRLNKKLDNTFYGKTKPLSTTYDEQALSISGFTRKQHEAFEDPVLVFRRFKEWINKTNKSGTPVLISDNNGYDASWINYYFHLYTGSNPFGWSSRRIGDLWGGFNNNPYIRWKRELRTTNHDHNPLNDAMGNAEALLRMAEKGLKLHIDNE